VQKNFDTFGSIRLCQMPPIESIIIQGGVGEPTIVVPARALPNVFLSCHWKAFAHSAFEKQRYKAGLTNPVKWR
jgi:hypothetical protein